MPEEHHLTARNLLEQMNRQFNECNALYHELAVHYGVSNTVDLGLLWSIADTFNGLMSIPNLIALLLLSGTVVKLVKEFFAKEPQ